MLSDYWKMKISPNAESQFAELASISGSSGKKVALIKWQQLDPLVAGMFPEWYRDLLSRHALAGVAYDIDTEHHQIHGIGLTEPDMLLGDVEELCQGLWAFRALIDSPYFPIGFTEDGDVFVSKRDLPTGVYEFRPESGGGDVFIAAVASKPQWEDLGDFAAELIPEDYEA